MPQPAALTPLHILNSNLGEEWWPAISSAVASEAFLVQHCCRQCDQYFCKEMLPASLPGANNDYNQTSHTFKRITWINMWYNKHYIAGKDEVGGRTLVGVTALGIDVSL